MQNNDFLSELLNFSYHGFLEDLGFYKYEMLIKEQFKNKYGILHGGIITAFIDNSFGTTSFFLTGKKAVTLNLTISFLSPGKNGALFSFVKVIKEGKSLITLEAKVEDKEKKVIATALANFFKLP